MESRRTTCGMRKNRKGERKNRKTERKTRRTYMGGASDISPASVNSDPMLLPMSQSLKQGIQFAGYHAAQHGGGSLVGGPYPTVVEEPTVLPYDLQASARVVPLNKAYTDIQNLAPNGQAGGKRRKAHRKSRKAHRKSRKSHRKSQKSHRKGRKSHRKATHRRSRGGAYSLDSAASFSAPGLLLSPAMEKQALMGMNSEWKLAENPRSFVPASVSA